MPNIKRVHSNIKNNAYFPWAAPYIMMPIGGQCPEGSVVNTLEACKAAASQLEKNYYNEKSGSRYPAGCFYYKTVAYFNTLVDLALIDDPFSFYGAICHNGGRLTVNYNCFTINHGDI